MADLSGTILGRSLALLGVSLLGALVHSWAVEVDVEIPEPTARPSQPAAEDSRPEGRARPQRPERESGREGEDSTRALAGDEPDEPGETADEVDDPGFQPLDLATFDPAALGSRLTLGEAEALHRLMQQGEFIFFFDAREAPGQYEQGHIEGALHVTAAKIDDADPQTMQLLQGYITPDMRIVIYCGGGDCDESDNVRRRLYQMGFSTTHVFEGGFPQWRDAGLPVATGEGRGGP